MDNIIEINDVRKTYSHNVYAVDGVSFSVRRGEFLVILGNSGSGKTTLLNMLGGLDTPTSGSISVTGREIHTFSERELTNYRRDCIGFVFQAFNLLAELTVLENVLLTAKTPQLAISAIEKVGLSEKKDMYPSELSGGQQQRVSIARALAKGTDILLCDEPTGALDYETGRSILSYLIDLVRIDGKTVVMVTHTKEIGKLADHVVTMKNGKVISEVFNDQVMDVRDVEW